MAQILQKTLQVSSRSVFYQQTRNRGKVNLRKPRVPPFRKVLLEEFVKPVYPVISKDVPLSLVCGNLQPVKVKSLGAYEMIIAREAADWFMKSPMIGFLHMNSMKSDKLFDFQVKLRKGNMYYKTYSKAIVAEALRQANLLHVAPLLSGRHGIVFGLEKNVAVLQKVLKSTPQCILLAGILDNHLLRIDEFLKYGNMTDEQIYGQLVSTLQTAGGMNLNRQLIHHQSTFIQRLRAIEKRGEDSTDQSKDVSEKQ